MHQIKKLDIILLLFSIGYVILLPFPIYKPGWTVLAFITILASYILMSSVFLSVIQFCLVFLRLCEGILYFHMINKLESQVTFILCMLFFSAVLLIATIDKYRKWSVFRLKKSK